MRPVDGAELIGVAEFGSDSRDFIDVAAGRGVALGVAASPSSLKPS